MIVVVAYGQILPREVLEIPRFACLNLHASLLPRWRGAAPIQAAIAAGDCETGITVMYMDEGLDTGDILLQRSVEILPNDTGGSLHDRLAQVAPEALLESLRLLAAGNAPRIPQDNARATYAPKLKREHGQIDWSESAEAIERKIRAYNPWPGAFMKVDRQNLKIFSASVVDLAGQPGEILRSDKDLIVAAGKGALSFAEVQLEGKRRMSAGEFLRGHGALVGRTLNQGSAGIRPLAPAYCRRSRWRVRRTGGFRVRGFQNLSGRMPDSAGEAPALPFAFCFPNAAIFCLDVRSPPWNQKHQSMNASC